MILNTLDHLGKFDAKGDEGYFVGYSVSSKAFRVFNKRTKKVEENLHVDFLENKLIEKGAGPNWLFDIDTLTNSMNYVPVVIAETSSTNILGTKDAASQGVKKDVSSLRYIALPNWFHEAHMESSNNDAQDACNADAPESSGISNPTATSKSPPAEQMESLTVESVIPIKEPKKIFDALKDPCWVEAMQEELLQFKIQNVWILVDCPKGVDVKSAFLYGTIDEEVYVMQPLGFQDPEFPDRVYKVEKAMYGLHQAPRAWSTNTPMDNENPWGKDGPGKDVELYLYRSMIRSLMYLTASRPDIMFAVCAGARHQVTPKECHLHAVKRIFRYLKGHPKLGLWYPKESPFDLVAYSDSDYGGATQDRKSTTRGCQFLGRRLISWQCKKQTIVATFITEEEYVVATSGCRQVLWIQNQMLDYRLAFCDYHNMIAILEKSEHNVDFHQIVDFIEASNIRYALTINPTVYVSHIRQFWSTARIKTTNEGTKIIATVDGKPRTISESSIQRNLKLNDEEGISSLPDTELFENLALMGDNILPNQKFTFQKEQFYHQWKFLIHTIMQCLSPKSTGFNEFSSNITTTVVCLATNRVYNFLKMIFDGMVRNVNSKGEGSGTPTESHHTPSPHAQQSLHHDLSSSLHLSATTETIPTTTPTEIFTLRHYSRRATRIAQSKALPTAADEPASLLRDDSQGEAFPTVSGLEAGHDRENIIKTSALPPDS
nr:hypothetical protein [Tanacetum cinerariifolium]